MARPRPRPRYRWLPGPRTLTVAAALAALAAGLVLPVEGYLALVALVFLTALVAVALSAQMGRPALGVAALVALSVALPVEFRGPAGVMMSSSLPLATMLAGLWIVRLAIVRRSVPLQSTRVVYAALTFMTVVLLSFTMGQYPWFPSPGAPLPAQVAELGIFLVSVCVLLAVGHQLQTPGQLRALVWILVTTGLVTCLFQMLPSLHFIARWTTRPGSVGSLFWTWLVAVSFAQAVFNRALGAPSRLALIGITGLVFYHGLVEVRSWASGWVPPLVAVGVIVFWRLPRFTVGAGLVAVPLGLLLGGGLLDELLREEAYSLSTRQEAWQVLWALVERSPLLGTGPANYYYYTENFPILGWYVRFISHNNYQDLLIQTGIAGLLTFCWLAFELYLMLVRLYRRVPAGFAKAYVVGAGAGLTGSLVSGMLGDWIIPFYYNAGILGFRSSVLFWIFLGGALALHRMVPVAATADVQASRQPVAVPNLARPVFGAL